MSSFLDKKSENRQQIYPPIASPFSSRRENELVVTPDRCNFETHKCFSSASDRVRDVVIAY